MIKFNNNEDLIKNELNEMLKVFKRGAEFSWTEIGKSNYIIFLILIFINIRRKKNCR